MVNGCLWWSAGAVPIVHQDLRRGGRRVRVQDIGLSVWRRGLWRLFDWFDNLFATAGGLASSEPPADERRSS